MCSVYVYGMYTNTCLSLYGCEFMCVQLRSTAIRTRSMRSGLVTGDSELCSLWTRYTGDSKTDLRDDQEICTGSCSEDQTAIWFQNTSFHVSICSYVFSLLLLPVCVHISVCIISCDHMIYFNSMITHITSWDIAVGTYSLMIIDFNDNKCDAGTLELNLKSLYWVLIAQDYSRIFIIFCVFLEFC